VPDNVASVDGAGQGTAGELYLTVVPDGKTVLLKDTARLIWLIAAEGGDVLAEVAALVGEPPEAIEADVHRFLADLTGRGLLATEEQATPGRPPQAAASSRAGAHRAARTSVGLDRSTWDKVRRHVLQRLDQAFALTVRKLGPAPKTPAWDGDPRIALLTVNFSTTRYLKLMLLTLAEQNDLDLLKRIVVCDNGSRDGAEPFLTDLESQVDRVTVTRHARPASHARGMRAALRALREAERGEDKPANILLFCDTDVVFRNPDTLRAVADRFRDRDVAFVGELRRGLFAYPEAQASFLAVRRDWAERRTTAPWVDHGSPAYWLQRSIWREGGRGDDFPSNMGGYILHRGRAGVAAAQEYLASHHRRTVTTSNPHFMGVPDGEQIWQTIEDAHASILHTPPRALVAQGLAASFMMAGHAHWYSERRD